MDASKYARVEIERRFLLAGVPDGEVLAVNEIDDRYLDGDAAAACGAWRRSAAPRQLKLTQKLPDARRARSPGGS